MIKPEETRLRNLQAKASAAGEKLTPLEKNYLKKLTGKKARELSEPSNGEAGKLVSANQS